MKEIDNQPLKFKALQSTSKLFAQFPSVQSSVANIAGAIKQKAILPADLLCIVDLKVASIVKCPT